jgi:hypothetical protein
VTIDLEEVWEEDDGRVNCLADGFVVKLFFVSICRLFLFNNGLVAKLAGYYYRSKKRSAKAQRADTTKFSPSVIRSQTWFTKAGNCST